MTAKLEIPAPASEVFVSLIAGIVCVLFAADRSLADPPARQEAPPAGSTQKIADRVCLFLDDRFVAEQSGLTHSWHPGRPLPEPAITASAPWDLWPHLFGSVVYDPQDKLYKMWYSSLREGMFYAESPDGKTWTKPNLGLHDIGGSKDNNLVMPAISLPNVFLDPNEQDPEARYKLFAWDHAYYSKEPKEDRADGHKLFQSGDGIHWTAAGAGVPGSLMAESERCSNFICPDTNQVIWDSLAGRYLCTFRTYPKLWEFGGLEAGRRRSIGVTTSDKISGGWKPIVTVMQPDDQDDQDVKAIIRDQPDPKWAEYYVMPVFNYGNHYIGMLSRLFVTGGIDNAVGSGDLQVTFSHDGVRWQRPAERQPLIGPSSATDLHPTYAACSAPLEMGDELWIYYAEANSSHPAKEHPQSQIRAAAWRKDGFASLKTSGEQPGAITTPPLLFAGGRLELNVQTENEGEVRVQLLDADGSPLEGFEQKRCDPLQGDLVRHVVSWQGKSDVSSLQNRPIRLRITLTKSRLYGFRFAP
ncbi:MAG: hypothetical protein H0T51_01335 [Pirellulales bacterium]|nr:hypothetical protein [Pirellulales bacterium]